MESTYMGQFLSALKLNHPAHWLRVTASFPANVISGRREIGQHLRRVAFSLRAINHYFTIPRRSLRGAATRLQRLLIFLSVLGSLATAQTSVGPRTIRVVVDNAYAPYSFQSDDGRLQGILIDEWQAWQNKTGVKTEIVAMDWGEGLRRIRDGEFDVIESIFETPERDQYFDFTPPYTTIEASIYFRRDISGITDLASLKGFPVGVKTGDQHIDKLKANGVTTVIPFQNNEAIIEAAKEHKINVFLADDPSALYLLNKAGIEDDFRHSAPVFHDELRRAVRKGDAATLRLVSEGFAAIDPGESKQIEEKWFGRTINRYGRYLTYAGYAVAIALLLIAGLAVWNRALRKRILQRTAALGESEERFRQIAENIREVFWLSTADLGSTLYVSPAYENVWGRSRESLYKDPRSFFTAIHPEDRPRVLATIERDRDRGFEVEYRVVRPDGSIRSIRDRGFPITDESGRFYRVAGIAEDITERKQAEEKLKQSEQHLAEAEHLARVGSWNWDLQTNALDWSAELYRIFRLDKQSFVPSYKAVLELIHMEDRASVMHAVEMSLKTGESFSSYYRIVRPDKQKRVVHARGSVVTDESGKPIRMLGTTQDVTERMQAEEQLQATSEQLRALSARLQSAREEEGRRIAREIHDELGSMLTGLKWDLEEIGRTISNQINPLEVSALSEKLNASIKLTDIALDTLRRIASELRPSVLDDLGLTAAIEWQAQQFQTRTGIFCNCDCSEYDLELNEEQATAVFRIFQEALTNILRHAQATRVEIKISKENSQLTLSVSDNGKGIKVEEILGTESLGLLGMRERAHLVGGHIEVKGREGNGTVVVVRVPLFGPEKSLKMTR
jgi:PAS domain S-box-containing protein